MSEMIDFKSERLLDVLRLADHADLCTLIDYLTDRGKGRIALSKSSRERLVRFKDFGAEASEDLLALLEGEILSFGGNSVANFVRENTRGRVAPLTEASNILPISLAAGGVVGLAAKAAAALQGPKTVPYSEVLRDVAGHLNVRFHKDAGAVQVEEAIIASVVSAALEDMTPDELRQFAEDAGVSDLSTLTPLALAAVLFKANTAGFGLFKGALIIAQALSKAIAGKGLSQVQRKVLMRGLKFLTGPVGWAVTGALTVMEVASPAYRVTVPCVVYIAYIRQKAMAKEGGMDTSLPLAA